jgi:cyclohexa-1,5-dienecarbonyl-CoA hydratase
MGVAGWATRLPEVEDLYLNQLMRTDDAAEGLRSFLEKRKPNWNHRWQ